MTTSNDDEYEYSFRGKVTKIFFEDEETDFYIFLADDLSDSSGKPKKVKGHFFHPRIRVGLVLDLEGDWKEHQKYGPTFVASNAEAVYESNKEKEKYLAASVPSIGPVNASKILKELGYDEAFDRLDNEVNPLKNVSFLSRERARAVVREWRKSRAYGNVADELLNLGVPTGLIKDVFSVFGAETIEEIKDNPYRLAMVDKVRFPVADRIALNMGFSPDSEFRIASILEYLLELASRKCGHLYLKKGHLRKRMNELPEKEGIKSFGRDLTEDDIDKALQERVENNRVIIDGDCVYLKRNYQMEYLSAEKLANLTGDHDLGIDTDEFIEEYERIYDIEFSEKQAETIHALNNHQVLLLTGLPGTGKCVSENTLVSGPWGFSSIGRFLPDDLEEDESRELIQDLDTSEGVRKSAYVYNGGVEETIKLTTQTGYEIEGTPEHPIRVVEEGEVVWKRLGDIEEDDPAVLIRGGKFYSFGDDDLKEFQDIDDSHFNEKSYEFPDKMSPDLARIMGYLTSEGSVVDSNHWTITAHDDQIREYLLQSFEELFEYEPNLHYDKRYDGYVGVRIDSTQIIRWFRKQGVKPEYANSKSIPSSVLESSKTSLTAYLSSLFEGDGSFNPDRYSIEYGTSSERLSYEVQEMLLALGVVSSRIKKEEGRWNVRISGIDYCRFQSEVGFHFTEMPDRERENNSNKHLLYGIQPHIKELFEEVKPLSTGNYNMFYRSATGRRTPTRDHVEKLLEVQTESNELTEKISDFMREDFFYDPVREVEKDKSQVVDFGVPSNHEFISAGFISHNTTLTKALVRLFKKADKKFKLMSPTGIAAKKLSNVVGEEAGTIHRTLGYQGDDWDYGEENKYDVDAVIVDEASMIDQELVYRLLASLNDDTILVFVGDDAQLPSVGAGNVLREMIDSDVIKRIHLQKIFRQEGASDIVVNAHRINAGEDLELSDPTEDSTDFKFISEDNPENIVEGILHVVDKLFNSSEDCTFQVLSPTYKGSLGVDLLNERIKGLLNPPQPHHQEVNIGNGKFFREDDRIMVVENDYDLDVFNGEIGKIHRINNKEKQIKTKIFDEPHDRLLGIPFDRARDLLMLSYAITVHKCVHPDTLVETEKGLMRIEEVSEDGRIATPSGMKRYQNKVHNPPLEAYSLSTNKGYGLTVTQDHGVDVWDGSEYVRREASEIDQDDFLRFRMSPVKDTDTIPSLPEPTSGDPREKVYETTDQVSEDFAKFIGLMLADGCVFHSGFRLVKRHSDVVERFGELCRSLFECDPREATVPSNIDASGLTINSTYLSRWLSSLECLDSNDKQIPKFILRSPFRIQTSFLRGLFADGTVNVRDGLVDHIALTQKDSDVLQVVQLMLLRMGIVSNRTSPPSNDQDNLALYGENIVKFREKIGFVSDFKQSRLVENEIGKSRQDVVPLSEEEVWWLWDNHPESIPNGKSTRGNALARGYLSRSIVEDIRRSLDERGVCPAWLEERLQWYHGRVSDIEETKCESYCVEVPDGHQFLQNGCSGWNSQGQEFDHIIFPFHEQFSIQLQRNLLYTAVTRAKDTVFIFGQWKALRRAIRNDRVDHRNTKFGKRLESLIKKQSE